MSSATSAFLLFWSTLYHMAHHTSTFSINIYTCSYSHRCISEQLGVSILAKPRIESPSGRVLIWCFSTLTEHFLLQAVFIQAHTHSYKHFFPFQDLFVLHSQMLRLGNMPLTSWLVNINLYTLRCLLTLKGSSLCFPFLGHYFWELISSYSLSLDIEPHLLNRMGILLPCPLHICY